jgi:hypothetical protein
MQAAEHNKLWPISLDQKNCTELIDYTKSDHKEDYFAFRISSIFFSLDGPWRGLRYDARRAG